jgi:hypothetical protein
VLGFGPLAERALADVEYSPGTNVTLPALYLTLASSTLASRAGRNIGLSPTAITAASTSIALRAGRNVELPNVVLSIARPAVGILAGRYLGLPAKAIATSCGTLIARTGRIFNLANTLTVETDIGALGEAALGEFASGEGPGTLAEYTIAYRIRLKPTAVQTLSGRNLPLTATALTASAPVPEIYARHRKVKVQAILH